MARFVEAEAAWNLTRGFVCFCTCISNIVAITFQAIGSGGFGGVGRLCSWLHSWE
jgi:hypothetical protein